MKSPIADPVLRFAAGRQGLRLFLLSLSVLFAASLIGYVVVRVQSADWPPADMPPLPRLLWASTAVLVLSSATMQWALVSARRSRPRAAAVGMLVTLLLALTFLVVQARCWWIMLTGHLDLTRHLYAFTFYTLTALHALHVLGGLGPMVIVTINAVRGRYSGAGHAGITYCAMYWHFLGAVWLVLYATLLIGS